VGAGRVMGWVWGLRVEGKTVKRVGLYLLGFFLLQVGVVGLDALLKTWFDLQVAFVPVEERLSPFEVPFYVNLMLLLALIACEEIVFRLLPYRVLERILKTRGRKLFCSFIIISCVIVGLAHQTAVLSGSLAARGEYFLILVPSSVFLCWVYYKDGFWMAWVPHVAWDLAMFGLILFGLG
jgi:hypothetical protein